MRSITLLSPFLRPRALLLLSLIPAAAPYGSRFAQDERRQNLETFDAVWTTVRDKHFDPELGGVDWEAVGVEFRPQAEEAGSREELRYVLNRMLDRLHQSHLRVTSGGARTGAETEDEAPAPGEEVWDTGCGFEVGLVDGVPRVASVETGSAVEGAGVRAGFGIANVGATAIPRTCEYTGEITSALLKAPGPAVVVGFTDPEGDRPLDVTIPLGERRSRVYRLRGMPAQSVWIEHRRLYGDVGYIAFNWFLDPVLVMNQFELALSEFEDTEGLIVDVRGNGGGLGFMASGIVGWFASGEIHSLGTMKARECSLETLVEPRARRYRGPVAVLIDGGSGSTAEVFAAGMRDVGGARLFGQRTVGAVLPSTFVQLPNGDYLQYSVSDYTTVEGAVLEGDGVAPDVETSPARRSDPEEDEAIQAAMEWILDGQ